MFGRGERRTGSSLGKIFKNTRGSRRPRRFPSLPSSTLLPTLFSQIAFYVPPPFFRARGGALGFFSYPLAGHLPLRKGRPRCRICGEGLGRRRGRRIRARARAVRRQTRDDPSRSGGWKPGRKEDGENTEEIEGQRPSFRGNGLRPSLRSQLAALCVCRPRFTSVHVEDRLDDAACGK